MPIRLPSQHAAWRETWRVLAYTLVVALGFIAIGRTQLALMGAPAARDWLVRAGWVDVGVEAQLAQQAAGVAAQSQAALARLPPGHRLAAVRMGYELGYVSQWVGGYALSAPAVQAQARTLAAPHLQAAQQQAQQLGIAPEAALEVHSLREFGELDARFELDENGAAGRIEQTLSPLHKHLYLLGVHLGKEWARVEGSGGELAAPPALLIRRHATLAGVAPALWQPLAAMPQNGEAPAQVLARYRAALLTLGAGLAGDDSRNNNPP